MSSKVKRLILVQDGLRRMYNCSPGLPEEDKARILEEFAMCMKVSGHSESFRGNVVKAVIDKYTKDLNDHMEGRKPLYRCKQERNIKLKNRQSKVSWLGKMGYNNMLVLPSTPGSELLKRVNRKLRNMEEPKEIKTYIKEDYGVASKQLISKSDPFPKQECGNRLCMACTGGDNGGAKCQRSNVCYSIVCKMCHKEYIGTTARNCSTRSVEHLRKRDSAINKHIANNHPENQEEVVNQYSMKMTGCYKDAMTRQVTEAVKISRAVKMRKELLNERKEFSVLRLVKLSASCED